MYHSDWSFEEPEPAVTQHARSRMVKRCVSPEAVKLVLRYGREVYARSAFVYAIGRKEVASFRRRGIELSPCAGILVVCAPDGAIMTVYRNKNFRSLRRRKTWLQAA